MPDDFDDEKELTMPATPQNIVWRNIPSYVLGMMLSLFPNLYSDIFLSKFLELFDYHLPRTRFYEYFVKNLLNSSSQIESTGNEMI